MSGPPIPPVPPTLAEQVDSVELWSQRDANHGFNAANLGSMGSMMGASADYDSQVMPIVQDFLKNNQI